MNGCAYIYTLTHTPTHSITILTAALMVGVLLSSLVYREKLRPREDEEPCPRLHKSASILHCWLQSTGSETLEYRVARVNCKLSNLPRYTELVWNGMELRSESS